MPAATARPSALPVVRTPSPRPAHRPSQAQLSALPGYFTRLLGADPACARLKASLANHRLVTVAGPGGAGTTPLADERLGASRSALDPSTLQQVLSKVSDPVLQRQVLAVRGGRGSRRARQRW